MQAGTYNRGLFKCHPAREMDSHRQPKEPAALLLLETEHLQAGNQQGPWGKEAGPPLTD